MFNLDLSLSEIRNNIRKSLINQIEKMDKSNLKLLQSNDISVFYEMEEKKYRKKGISSPIISQNYLKDLFDTYPENLKLYYLYDNNNDIIRAQLDCDYKDRSILWLGGTRQEGNKHYNEYMIWSSIKRTKDIGYKKLEWGGGPKNVCQFKSRFNPNLGIYFDIYRKDNLGKFAEWTYLNFMQNISRYQNNLIYVVNTIKMTNLYSSILLVLKWL